ncbi:T9SS C-terminal target domain-containing protein [Neptunitalea chrysea]|uniref:T9SS C-terminal target domain-containing protein n=1 Tax=Neptunitalea chrysea TaxID=1647581 RepID=A0A9W6EUA3_9FLAO|nr:T9SS type A sorting domain-containing protein [Neptunitalea chrysea]GLB53240.1 T9SS C-terminal target domain-containing protein [Neptunitalea chrysea]
MKKIILLFTLLLATASVSYAQLRVNDSSFVYVKDTYLYVKQDIDLNDDGYLYLRENGQLLQGTNGTSSNKGNGNISIIQAGNATQYTYNYWSSPVGSVVDTTQGNGKFYPLQSGTINDSIGLINSNPAGFTSGYNGTSDSLIISRRWLYKFNQGSSYNQWSFIGHSNGTGYTNPGYGFSMKGTDISDHKQPYDFRGRPNDGDIQVVIKPGNETLIGNPYPSAIDIAAFLLDPDNIGKVDAASILYWQQDMTTASHYVADYVGGYGVWVPDCSNVNDCEKGTYALSTYNSYDDNGNITGTASATIDPNAIYSGRRFAPVGQGFMVKGNASLSGPTTLTFKNSHRVFYKEDDNSYSTFNRIGNINAKNIGNNTTANVNIPSYEVVYNNGAGTQALSSYERPKYVFQVIVNETYTRDLLLTLNDNATIGFDYGFDGISPSELDTDAAFDINGQDYFIQSTAFNVNDLIPLHFKTNGSNTTFKILIGSYINVDANQNVYIYDSALDLYTPISDSSMFTFSSSDADISNRYYVAFTSSPLSAETVLSSSDIYVHQNNDSHVLLVKNPSLYTLKNVELFSMTGQQIFNEGDLGTEESYTFNTSNLTTGVYLVNITTTNNQVVTKKIAIKN